MIRYLLKELVAKKAFHEGRRIDWLEVAEKTDIHRVTLSKMVNHRGYNSTTTNLDKLCKYFDCKVAELIEYVPDELLDGEIKRSAMGPKANTAAAQAGVKARYKAGPKPAKETRRTVASADKTAKGK